MRAVPLAYFCAAPVADFCSALDTPNGGVRFQATIRRVRMEEQVIIGNHRPAAFEVVEDGVTGVLGQRQGNRSAPLATDRQKATWPVDIA